MTSRRGALFALLLSAWLPAAAVDAALAAPVARNVILVIGDGMGFNQVLAADYFLYGEEGRAPFEALPVALAASTYPAGGWYDPAAAWSDFAWVGSGAADSAASATSLATGWKTSPGAVGVAPDGTALPNVVEAAEATGRRSGIVTSVPISHATPASFAAHWPDRSDYPRLARQMILQSGLDVLMGAGHPWYGDDGERASAPIGFSYVGGEKLWAALKEGRAGGDADGDGVPDPWTLVTSRPRFRSLAEGPAPGRVLGIARVHTTLQQSRPGDAWALPGAVPLLADVPSLREMTLAALNVLSGGAGGFFLMVEGGAIDWACHAGQTGRLVEEERALYQAVRAAMNWVEEHSSWAETLLVVTGDHETGYLVGPGSDPGWNPPVNDGAGTLPGIEWRSGGHTNSLVGLWARGPGAMLLGRKAVGSDPVRGPYLDNTDVADVIFSVLR